MKVICDRAALLEALGLVGGVIVARTPKPQLTCVHLAADNASGGLTLAATDLEVAVKVTTPQVEIQEEGESLIPADKLSQIVRESVDPTIAISVEQDTAVITGRDSKFKVFGYAAGEFPEIPNFSGEADFEVSAGELNKMINQTAFASARETSRYAINGVLMEREGNKLAIVATDSRRLAVARGACKSTQEGVHSAIVPTKALNLLHRVLDEPDQIVRVKVADNQIIFATESAMVSSRLVEGNFPPYKDVVPKDNDKKAKLSTDQLSSAVRRAALLTNEESKGVRFAFSPGNLTLSSRAPEMGEAEVQVDVPHYEGDPIEIGFNPQFLLDALKVVEADEVQLDFKAPNKPGVLRTGNDYMYVIMPVNLRA